MIKFFFSSRRRHTRYIGDWSSDVCSSDLEPIACGEQRDGLGRLRRAFILTRAIPGAMTLPDFVQKRCADRGDATSREMRECLLDRKSTRLNSSHRCISYAVFCLKKKKKYK